MKGTLAVDADVVTLGYTTLTRSHSSLSSVTLLLISYRMG